MPVPKKDAMKAELENLVSNQIIAPVTEPTNWVSSVLAVPKKDGSIRVCLDPKDLNTAIKRSHYPLPTMDDVTSRLTKAKVFEQRHGCEKWFLAREAVRKFQLLHHV